MPTERTPLLAEAGPSSPASAPAPAIATLHEPATDLLEWVRHSTSAPASAAGSSSPPVARDPFAHLAVYLYALHLSSISPGSRGSSSSIRVRMMEMGTKLKIQAWLYDLIETYLDRGATILNQLEETVGTADENGEMEEEVEDMVWRRWSLGDGSEIEVSVIDLLLPPYTSSSSPSSFLSHPLIRHVLEHTWRYGVPEVDSSEQLQLAAKPFLTRWQARLEEQITPRRTHLLQLLSFLIFFVLTLALAIQPGGWISPLELPKTSPNALEIIYSIWALATFLAALPLLAYALFLLPAALTPVLALRDPASAFTTLTMSIPLLTFCFISTYPLSLIYLSPSSLVPLSTLLSHILRRGMRAAGLILPLTVVLFLIFTWSMNGDIFRGFLALIAPRSVYHLAHQAANEAEFETGLTPREDGIAPFETRLWLFITILTLFLLSIILTIARSITPSFPPTPYTSSNAPTPRWQGGMRAEDTWEREYGLVVGRKARSVWARAVRDSVGPQSTGKRIPVIAPLNLLIFPFNIAIALGSVLGTLRMFGKSRGAGGPDPATGWTALGHVRRFRELFQIYLMGSLCALLGLYDKLIRTTGQ